ncbi:hypothetical protein [Brevundimonas sp.]|jgi:hypothetical protein|uniref:hypothetical protein n=1 Tax=Brevundimonas sp. TaxID=1871086 RepID=UPI00260B2A41|nr:hypothetical protein [Brevundimonas sp.]
MRRLFSTAALTAGLFLAAASSAQTPSPDQRNDFCYLECQYRCYIIYPGGGPAWTRCYLQCAAERCGYVG